MIRKIDVNIDKKGKVTSTSDSFLGVCGETNASEICFILCDELINAIKQTAAEKALYYRFEVTDAQSRHFILENKEFESGNSFSLGITNAFTEYDGKITVQLVIESEGFTLCTVPVDLRVEKSCNGASESADERSTVVTIFNQAQAKADAALLEMQTIAEQTLQSINADLEQSNNILNECEQRKNAAETAAVNAIAAANAAAQAKQATEQLLSTKEDVANKETNLMQDVLPDHTKYASAKATQEFVNATAAFFSGEMNNNNARLEGIKADKTALEETNALLAETQEELTKAKAEIERLKTAEEFVLLKDIVCDGSTSNFYLGQSEPLKKIYVAIRTSNLLSKSMTFNCYANSYNTVGCAFAVTTAAANTRWFRMYSERITDGVWKTDLQLFNNTIYGSNWATSYGADDINYITNLRITCGDGESLFLPEGTTIKIYGVKA